MFRGLRLQFWNLESSFKDVDGGYILGFQKRLGTSLQREKLTFSVAIGGSPFFLNPKIRGLITQAAWV